MDQESVKVASCKQREVLNAIRQDRAKNKIKN